MDYVYRTTRLKYGRYEETRLCKANSVSQQIAYRKAEDKHKIRMGREPNSFDGFKIERGVVENWTEVPVDDWKPSRRSLLVNALNSDEFNQALLCGYSSEQLADVILRRLGDK